MECYICEADGFELMPQLRQHMKEEHEDKPETEEQLHFYTCACMKRNWFYRENPGRRENVEYVEEDEHPVKIECECGETIEGM